MRRNTILLTALPLANALSLANFQDITSILIPTTCLLTYDQQIPLCKVADFESPGCSDECEAQLTQLAKVVIKACSNVIVNSNTLLGIVKSGKILGALCPSFNNAPAPAPAPTTAAPVSTPPPQTSAPVVTRKSTTSTRQAQTATETSDQSQSTRSTLEPVTQPTDTPTAEPTPSRLSTDNGLGFVSSTGTKSAAKSTDTAGVKNKNTDGGKDTGGGSPFDISANTAAPHVSRNPTLAIVIAIGAVLLTAR